MKAVCRTSLQFLALLAIVALCDATNYPHLQLSPWQASLARRHLSPRYIRPPWARKSESRSDSPSVTIAPIQDPVVVNYQGGEAREAGDSTPEDTIPEREITRRRFSVIQPTRKRPFFTRFGSGSLVPWLHNVAVDPNLILFPGPASQGPSRSDAYDQPPPSQKPKSNRNSKEWGHDRTMVNRAVQRPTTEKPRMDRITTRPLPPPAIGNEIPVSEKPVRKPQRTTPPPAIDEIPETTTTEAEEGSTKVSNSLHDIGKPGNPYALINVMFPPPRPEERPSFPLNEDELQRLNGLEPEEVFRAEGDILILRGGHYPKEYQSEKPDNPIDDYEAPYREPKLPPPGLEFGGPGGIYEDPFDGIDLNKTHPFFPFFPLPPPYFFNGSCPEGENCPPIDFFPPNITDGEFPFGFPFPPGPQFNEVDYNGSLPFPPPRNSFLGPFPLGPGPPGNFSFPFPFPRPPPLPPGGLPVSPFIKNPHLLYEGKDVKNLRYGQPVTEIVTNDIETTTKSPVRTTTRLPVSPPQDFARRKLKVKTKNFGEFGLLPVTQQSTEPPEDIGGQQPFRPISFPGPTQRTRRPQRRKHRPVVVPEEEENPTSYGRNTDLLLTPVTIVNETYSPNEQNEQKEKQEEDLPSKRYFGLKSPGVLRRFGIYDFGEKIPQEEKDLENLHHREELTTETPVIASLEGDTDVNYEDPLPPLEPESEYVTVKPPDDWRAPRYRVRPTPYRTEEGPSRVQVQYPGAELGLLARVGLPHHPNPATVMLPLGNAHYNQPVPFFQRRLSRASGPIPNFPPSYVSFQQRLNAQRGVVSYTYAL